MRKILFRVDGNEIIASGHIMRCLSIAEQVRKLGNQTNFLIADSRPKERIEQQGFQCDILGSTWNDLEKETDKLICYIEQKQIEVIFVDSYYVTYSYLQKLAQHTRVVYIDDLNAFVYPVDTVINYGAWPCNCYSLEDYRQKGLKTEFLIGTEYVPLREEFMNVVRNINPEVKKVLITTGGTDQLHISQRLLHAVLDDTILNNLEYHVIVGCFNSDHDALYKLAENHNNIHIHENVSNMSWWMQQCDMAVSAAGTTLYEFAACGTPTICMEIAENQYGASRWDSEGYMLYAGNAALNTEKSIKCCVKLMKQYITDYELRYKFSNAMQRLVDGQGAKRIAEYLQR